MVVTSVLPSWIARLSESMLRVWSLKLSSASAGHSSELLTGRDAVILRALGVGVCGEAFNIVDSAR